MLSHVHVLVGFCPMTDCYICLCYRQLLLSSWSKIDHRIPLSLGSGEYWLPFYLPIDHQQQICFSSAVFSWDSFSDTRIMPKRKSNFVTLGQTPHHLGFAVSSYIYSFFPSVLKCLHTPSTWLGKAHAHQVKDYAWSDLLFRWCLQGIFV